MEKAGEGSHFEAPEQTCRAHKSPLVARALLMLAASTQYGYGRIRYVLTEREPSALLEDPQSGLQRPHLVLWQGTKAAQGDSFIRLWNDTTTQQYCLLISVFGGEAEDNVKVRDLGSA